MDNSTSRPAPSFLPATAVMEMTYNCNHTCIFCSCPWYADGNGFDKREEMPSSEWKELISELCTKGIMNIAFTGGEPLLKEGIEEIISHAAHSKTEHIETEDGRLVSKFAPPNLFLLSNGKIMSEDILDLCAEFSINLSMSLPGLKTFPEHTGGEDPQKVLNWFRKAKEKGVATTVGVTVTKKNIHELYETISEALLAGADNLLMNRFLPGGRGLYYADDLMLSKDDITVMLDTAEEILTLSNREGSVGTELPKCLVDLEKYRQLSVGTRCSAAIDFFVIDPSGYIRVCNHSPERLAHWRESESLKQDPYWKSFTMKDYLPEACSDCSLMTECDGGCREAAHVTGGKTDSQDPALS